MGLPWLVPRFNASLPLLNNTLATSYAMNISHFSNPNVTIEFPGYKTVSFRYKLLDFQGTGIVFTGSEVLSEMRCQAWIDYRTQLFLLQLTVLFLITDGYSQCLEFEREMEMKSIA